MTLWTWDELEEALATSRTAALHRHGPAPEGVSIDSRSLRPGDLFVALSGDPGPRFQTSGTHGRDGHEFIAQALAAGARALLVDRAVDAAVAQLQVADTLDGLWALGAYARERCPGRVIAITGSSGKTTARTFVEALLRERGRVHASEGSLNNHWGVPLSLARMPRDSEFGIFELGTNHPGEIAPLAQLVAPHVALVLNVAPAHLGHFADLDAIRQEKLSIVSGLRPGGTLVVPAALDLGGVPAPPRVVTFGAEAGADVHVLEVRPGVPWVVRASVAGRPFEFTLAEGGTHRVATALAAVAVLHALGLEVADAGAVLSRMVSPAGRGNRHRVHGITVVDDSYNANPASMAHALDLLRTSGARRRLAILGDMLELGGAAAEMHRGLVAHCDGLDRVLLVGPLMHHLYDVLPEAQRWGHVEQASALDLKRLAGELRAGDEVLVKGSNRMFWAHQFVRDLLAAVSASGSSDAG